jgi:hypothetical protein
MRHRVQKYGHPTVTIPRPKDEWRGDTFCANGEQFEVVACGKMPGPLWPEGMDCRRDVPARLHLKPRAGR